MKKHLQTILALFIVAVLANVGYHSVNPSHALTGNVTTQAPSLPSVTATSVDSFIASQAVNIHTSYRSTPYGSVANIISALMKLHIYNVRDNISLAGNSSEIADVKKLQATRINTVNQAPVNPVNFDFGVGSLVNPNPLVVANDPVASLISIISSNQLNAASPITVEGANEGEASGDPNWATDDQAWQPRLYSAGHGIANTQVVGPSLSGINDGSVASRTNDAIALGNLVSSLDYGNVHAYPNLATPEGTINLHKNSESANVSGGKTVWATESGYNDCGKGNTYPCGTAPPTVSAADQGILDPTIFLAGYQNGIGKTFMYELFDEADENSIPNPPKQPFQDDWGLFNHDLSIKPSGQAIANMNSILLQNSTGSAIVPSLNYQLTAGGKLQQLLLAKHEADGDHYELIVWEDYLPSVPNTTFPITLNFSHNQNVVAYSPSSGAGPVANYTNVMSITNMSASPAITIFDITAGSTQVCPTGDTGTYPNCVAPTQKCPTGYTGTYPNCIAPNGGNGGGGSGGNSGNGAPGTISNPTHLSSLGAPNQPIKASSVTLTPQTNIPLSQIKKVSYFVNGKLIATVTHSPFSYNLTKANVGSGCNNIKTVVYSTDGSASSTSRQLCVAFTNSKQTEKQWTVAVTCIVIMIFIVLEFVPIYPGHRHLISRTSEGLWHKYFGHAMITSEPVTVAPINQYAKGPTSTSQTAEPGSVYKPKVNDQK